MSTAKPVAKAIVHDPKVFNHIDVLTWTKKQKPGEYSFVLESDYLAERKAREAAEAEVPG